MTQHQLLSYCTLSPSPPYLTLPRSPVRSIKRCPDCRFVAVYIEFATVFSVFLLATLLFLLAALLLLLAALLLLFLLLALLLTFRPVQLAAPLSLLTP